MEIFFAQKKIFRTQILLKNGAFCRFFFEILKDWLGRIFLTEQFLPEVVENWDKVWTNGLLRRVPVLHNLWQKLLS